MRCAIHSQFSSIVPAHTGVDSVECGRPVSDRFYGNEGIYLGRSGTGNGKSLPPNTMEKRDPISSLGECKHLLDLLMQNII